MGRGFISRKSRSSGHRLKFARSGCKLRHVFPSASLSSGLFAWEQFVSRSTGFREFFIAVFTEICREIQVWLKSKKRIILYEGLRKYVMIFREFFLSPEEFQTKVTEKIKTHGLCQFSPRPKSCC
jgi:hypothetical protein